VTKERFRILFDVFFDDIRRYLYYRSGDEVLSTDLAQDTFLRIWEKRLDLKPGKEKALLYKIAGDLFVSQIRRDRRLKGIKSKLDFELTEETPEDKMNYKELIDRYERALMKLPERQRIVFLMSRMEDLSYLEIAERLSLSVKAVEKRMSLALAHLRNVLPI
jgi:RNA polymerase sigma-70 factor (ECF subfamily)